MSDESPHRVEKVVDATWAEDDYHVRIKWEDVKDLSTETYERAREVCRSPEVKEQLRRAIQIADESLAVGAATPEDGPANDDAAAQIFSVTNEVMEKQERLARTVNDSAPVFGYLRAMIGTIASFWRQPRAEHQCA